MVQGRLHAFELAKALLDIGADVEIFTGDLPHFARRAELPPQRVHSFWLYGLLVRVLLRLRIYRFLERFTHPWFGRWACRRLRRCPEFDAVHVFSGVAEEIFSMLDGSRTIRTLMRGSSHIRTQATLLNEEAARVGRTVRPPNDWIIERELREYAQAQIIVVLSEFARKSFEDNGVSPSKLHVLTLGASTKLFQPTADMLARRRARVLGGGRLRVLTVGSFSAQKGAFDLVDIAKRGSGRMHFRFVGDVNDDVRHLIPGAGSSIEFVSRQPQERLRAHFDWADIFLLPTVQDGFAVVLVQAAVGGLPIVATTNSGAPEIIAAVGAGWIYPARNAAGMYECLAMLDGDRCKLDRAIERCWDPPELFLWSDVASRFVFMIEAYESNSASGVNLNVEHNFTEAVKP